MHREIQVEGMQPKSNTGYKEADMFSMSWAARKKDGRHGDGVYECTRGNKKWAAEAMQLAVYLAARCLLCEMFVWSYWVQSKVKGFAEELGAVYN